MKFYSVLFILLLSLPLAAQTSEEKLDSQAQESFRYLNDLRQQAGMIPFVLNQTLSKAAQSHADYLYRYKQWGHNQQPGRAGFTGRRPLDRMLAAGYLSRHNSENVSSHSGRATPLKSINGLMSAIYHRFGFLSFDYNEIGIGHASDEKFHTFVYDMGNAQKAALCGGKPEAITSGQYLYKICLNQGRKVSSKRFYQALQNVQLKNADVVVWPPNHGRNVPPAFYEESPDPLPDFDVSGYPVSVQFNPAHYLVQDLMVTRFELFQVKTGKPVEVIRQLNHRNDPNHKFMQQEYAIFPRDRLDWDSEYRAEVDFISHDKKHHQIIWTFRTAGFDVPLYRVFDTETIKLKHQQKTIAVYSPPTSAFDSKSKYQVSYRGFKEVKVKILDAHTLIITPIGPKGRATFDFHGKQFTLVK